jgi:hypothetical protein
MPFVERLDAACGDVEHCLGKRPDSEVDRVAM